MVSVAALDGGAVGRSWAGPGSARARHLRDRDVVTVAQRHRCNRSELRSSPARLADLTTWTSPGRKRPRVVGLGHQPVGQARDGPRARAKGWHAALLDLLPGPQRAHRPPQLAGGLAQPGAQAGLRRGHRRRRRARPRDRLLPRQGARHHQRRRARARLARRRQHRPQHHDLPLQLPLRRERRLLRPCAQALGGAEPGAELQRHVQPARRADAGAHRPRRAGRPAPHPRQPAQRRRQRVADAGAGQGVLPAAQPATTCAIRCWARPCSGAAARPATTRWPGATPAAPTRRGVDIIQNCEVTGIRREGDRVVGVETGKGFIAAKKVAVVAAGHTSVVMAHGRPAHAAGEHGRCRRWSPSRSSPCSRAW